LQEVEKLNRKMLIIITAVLLTVLAASSFFAISQAYSFATPKPEYVSYILKVTLSPTAVVDTSTDSSNYPVVVQDGYVPATGIISATATINGVVYAYPEDFVYNYTFHSELNVVSGY
jgi:hypothetical protein